MPKVLFILNDPPYGSERGYNGLRLAGALAKREAEVKVFLMGDAVSWAKRGQTAPQDSYNTELMLGQVTHHGGAVGVCGTCMDARGIAVEELAEGTQRGTLEQLADSTVWADQVLVF
jgi:uncharacterized protein involved in oxidation of intracellular sulfur